MIGRQTITITRQTPGDWVDGVFVPGDPYEFEIMGNVQPAGTRDVEHLPELARVKAAYVLYCYAEQTELNLTDCEKPAAPDRVRWNGRDHELQSLGDWSHFGGTASHRAYAMIEVGQEEDDE